MVVPIFSLKLNNKICAKTVVIGKYDGYHPCLTAATLAGKVFIHNPHQNYSFKGLGRSDKQNIIETSISLLNINATVTALATGCLEPMSKSDTLFIGTKTNVLAYDVNNNTDLFYKELPDGANAITVGNMGSIREPCAVVGGNCSIIALNNSGEEVLWTVTGDNITSLALIDYNSDGSNELIVGSEDFDIRVFKDDEIVSEMSETEAITGLINLGSSRFGYSLANGSVGVYDKNLRNWRIKSRNLAMDIYSFDINADGVLELITGWSSGKVDARNPVTGEVIFKCNLESSVAGLTNSDYKLDGVDQLICCSVEGEVRGYKPAPSSVLESTMDRNINQEAVRDMAQRKQNLLLELGNLEEAAKPSDDKRKFDQYGTQSTGIPANTQITSKLRPVLHSGNKKGHIELQLMTNNETIIRAVIIFAEGIFKGESYVVHPPHGRLKNDLFINLITPKDIAVDLHLQIMVGYENSAQFHVIEQTRVLPIFSMYCKVDYNSIEDPKGYVVFSLSERASRIVIWINNNFVLEDEIQSDTSLSVAFVSLRTNLPLKLKMEVNGQMTVKTDDMEMAGAIIQSLATYLNLSDLQVTCDFPLEFENLEQVLLKIDDFNSVRQQLTSEMADNSNLIRSLVVRAEDARLMDDIESMKQYFQNLMNKNRDLINGYKVRSTNHEELLKNVKILNQFVQRAGNLRVGRYKTDVIANARTAIKQNNFVSLVKIIKTGSA